MQTVKQQQTDINQYIVFTLKFMRIHLIGTLLSVHLAGFLIAGLFSIMQISNSFSQEVIKSKMVKNCRIEEVGITTARIAFNIDENSTEKILKYGVCWNKKGKPTSRDKKKMKENGKGQYSLELTGLKKATVYYVRAALLTEDGFDYGEEKTFSTHAFANGVQINLKFVRGGSFQMGCNNEEAGCYGDEYPVHEVMLNSFRISQYEITTSQYCAFLNEINVGPDGSSRDVLYIDVEDPDCPVQYSGSRFVPGSGMGNYPVTEVTWYGARAFCQWLGGRLPTEAEWEYAAKGGNKSKTYLYSGSNQLDKVGWYKKNSGKQIHPVGQLSPNELDLYDMSGNVWEWCHDWYGFDYYANSSKKNPFGPEEGTSRVMRGGAWNMDEWNCRISRRSSKDPGITYNYFGFRLLIPER